MANEVTITVKGRDQGGKKAADDAKKSLQSMGEVAQGIIAAQLFEQIGQSAQKFLGDTASATSDLGESMNAVNVVFKDSASGIKDIGETASTSMGLSQRAFNDAAVRFSNFAKEVAGPGGDVTQVIQDITQRSADFASVMNLDVNEAMQVFQSGLAGESEPLRRYGIDVSAAAVETFAYAEGIAKAGTELSEAQKIQARYGIIMQETAEMSGDFANTSDSLANQQRILNAEWENAQAVMGQAVVPAFQLLNAMLLPVLQAFQDLPGPVQTAISVLIVLGATALTVTSRIAPLIISMQAAGVSATAMAGKFKAAGVAMAGVLGPVGLIITALVAAQRHFQDESFKTRTEVSKLTEDLSHLAETGRVNTDLLMLFGEGAKASGDEAGLFGRELDRAADKSSSFGAKTKEVFDVLADGDNAMHQAAEKFEQLDEAMVGAVESGADHEAILQSLVDTYGLNEQQVQKLLEVLPEYREAVERAGESATTLEASTEALTGELESEQKALDDLLGSLFEVENQILGMRDAERALEEAIDTASESVKENGKTLNRNTEEGRNNEEALDGIASAAHKVMQQQAETGASTEDMRNSMERARKKFIDTAVQMGMTRGEARRLANQLGLIPEDVETTAKLRDQMTARINALERRLNALDGKSVDTFVNTFITEYTQRVGRSPGGRFAHGGIVGSAQAGGPRGNRVLVGELGPEVVEMAPGSRVIPSVDQATDRGQGPGGGGVLEVRAVTTGDRLLDEIVRSLSLRVRTEAGGSVDVLLGGDRR